MAERLVPEHEPLNLERSRRRFFPGTFFSDPAWIFQAAALLFLTAFFYWPLTRFLFGPHPLDPKASFLELKILFDFLGDSWNLGVLGFSFFQAFLSAFLSVLLGFGVAWIQVHYHFPGKRWFRLLTFLPFVLPSIVVVLAMILFFGNNGWINRGLMMFLGEKEPPLQFLYSLNGILIAHVYYNFPIAAKLIGDQWSRLSEDFERAARSLGAGGLNRFFGLTLPMLRPSLVSAFILIFLLCLNSFPIILVLGGGIHHTTIEVQIYQLARIELDLEGAAVLALLQALISISILALLIRTRSALGRPKKIYQRSLLVELSQAKAPAWISAIFLMLLMIFTLGPLVSVIIDSLREFQEGIWQWSVEGYLRLFRPTEGGPFLFALWNSFRIGVGGALISCLLGIGFSSLILRLESTGRNFGELVILLPMALSSVVFGISWFHFYQNSALFGISLEWILMAVHGILLCPYWVRMILPTMETVPRRWRDESRVLGHGAWEHQVRIVFPWLRSTFLIAFFFSFALSLGELNSTMMIADETVRTLPLEIYGAISAYRFSYASALAVILLLISLIALLLMEKILFQEEQSV